MKRLPAEPNLGQLKKQAKELLHGLKSGDPDATARLQAFPPPSAAKHDYRLHDAQYALAREYGFASWTELKMFVEESRMRTAEPTAALLQILRLIYAGDIAGTADRARPALAARMLAETPLQPDADPWIACAVGAVEAVRREIARDARWVHRAGGPLDLPPLVAVTHSALVRLPDYRGPLRETARMLLDAGADPNQSVRNRWPLQPGDAPHEHPLSALYGAAGQNHDAELTRLLLARGADPNDNESLYHSLEAPECTRLLLEAGARITGTNALYRALDLDSIEPLTLLLAHGADANEPAPGAPTSDLGSPLLWAVRRRRSPAHIAALLGAGANPSAATPDGETAYALARRFGLPRAAALIRAAGGTTGRATEQEDFIAACTEGDEAKAREVLSRRPDMISSLSETQRRVLPDLAAAGAEEAVRIMVRLGWPIATRGGDWNGSALNLAVFRGDARLARFLLEHGASWKEEHGFGDNVCGTLSWASINQPVDGGDWAACAEALLAHGLPPAEPDTAAGCVNIDGVRRRFSDDVLDVFRAAWD